MVAGVEMLDIGGEGGGGRILGDFRELPFF